MSRLSETVRVGSLEVAAISDSAPDVTDFQRHFPGAEAADWMREAGLTRPDDPVPFNLGSFLIRGAGRTTLVDAGYGVFGRTLGTPGCGELLERIAELGVALEEVDAVVQTHLHPDHVGWLIDEDRDNALTFPNATVYVSRTELDHWLSPEADPQRLEFVRRCVLPAHEAARIEPVDGEHTVFASPAGSLTMVPTPGHTPGHCSLLLSSGGGAPGGARLLITGDVAYHPAHVVRPEWRTFLEHDPAEAERSRRKVAELAIERDALVTGGHFGILTLGRVRRVEAGYAWEAVATPEPHA